MRDLVFIQHVGCFLSSPVWVIYLSGIVSVAFRHICSLPDNKLFVFCLSFWKGAFHLAGQPHFSFSHSYSRIPISTFFRIPVLQSFLCILFIPVLISAVFFLLGQYRLTGTGLQCGTRYRTGSARRRYKKQRSWLSISVSVIPGMLC